MNVELGLDTFGDVTRGPDGAPDPFPLVLRHVVEQGVAADAAGVDFFGVGEHHRPDFAVSAPEIVLAAIAARTSRVRLGSAVTVLGTDDPIRVFQRFATLDAVSHGRAEVVLGRGSFTESFPLFGFDLRHYGPLFEDKLDLFAALLEGGPVTWKGATRPPLDGLEVYPKTAGRLRAWIAVGGTPQSVVRAAEYGLPLMLAIIGGAAERFLPFVTLYRQALRELGHDEPLPIAVHSPGHVARTDDEARAELFPAYTELRNRIGKERGWGPMGADELEREAGPEGALYVGSPDTVATKIARTVRLLGLDRFDLKFGSGPLPHEASLRCIELYGREVAPRVRELLARPSA